MARTSAFVRAAAASSAALLFFAVAAAAAVAAAEEDAATVKLTQGRANAEILWGACAPIRTTKREGEGA